MRYAALAVRRPALCLRRTALFLASAFLLAVPLLVAPAFLPVSLSGSAIWPGAGIALADGFSDDFEDGIIDPAYWTYGGAITESDGVLHLDREDPGDFIETVSTFSGDWMLEMDIRLNYIVWNDMFHGITITNAVGRGISFGYSMYGKLYLGVHDGQGGTGFYYAAPGSNQPGQWLHWTITRTGGTVRIEVNGAEPFPGAWFVPDDARVSMPGFYEDGDGGQQIGETSSSVDFFSISDSSGLPDLKPGMEFTSWGKVKETYR